jgi:phospholipase C
MVAPGAISEDHWALASSSGWFDLSIANTDDAMFLRRFAGHVENGRLSTTDPATPSLKD